MTAKQNRWVRSKLDALKIKMGNRCWNCGTTEKLQFAHLKETGLNGKGRGRHERYFDIMHNPDCYGLLCGGKHSCHEAFDNGMIKIEDFKFKVA